MRVIFTASVQYENEGRNKGPRFPAGDVFDFTEDFAQRWLRRNVAIPFLFGKAPDVTENNFEAVLTGQDIEEAIAAFQAAEEDFVSAAIEHQAPPGASSADAPVIEIPTDWETMGFFKLQALVKSVTGEKPRDKVAASEAVHAELAKRAAAEPQT